MNSEIINYVISNKNEIKKEIYDTLIYKLNDKNKYDTEIENEYIEINKSELPLEILTFSECNEIIMDEIHLDGKFIDHNETKTDDDEPPIKSINNATLNNTTTTNATDATDATIPYSEHSDIIMNKAEKFL